MIYAQERKVVDVLMPTAMVSNATTTASIDTLGFDYLQLIWHLATATSTAGIAVECKVVESDDLTTYTAIVPFTGGTATSTSVGFVIPNAHATIDQQFVMNMDLRGRKRYLKCSISPHTNQINYIVGVLDRAKVMPDTIAEANVALMVNG